MLVLYRLRYMLDMVRRKGVQLPCRESKSQDDIYTGEHYHTGLGARTHLLGQLGQREVTSHLCESKDRGPGDGLRSVHQFWLAHAKMLATGVGTSELKDAPSFCRVDAVAEESLLSRLASIIC